MQNSESIPDGSSSKGWQLTTGNWQLLRWIRNAFATAALWFMVGFGLGVYIAPRAAPIRPAPVPVPVPIPAPADTVNVRGHLTVSLIEPLYVSPATAAIRNDLAATNWSGLDTTFRAYTHGQSELDALGFTSHYTTADLPIVFFQETLPSGSAPLVPPPLKPLSAAAVIDHVKELRGSK
jgi:hypothetical protein